MERSRLARQRIESNKEEEEEEEEEEAETGKWTSGERLGFRARV